MNYGAILLGLGVGIIVVLIVFAVIVQVVFPYD